jgi:hypothetical protein
VKKRRCRGTTGHQHQRQDAQLSSPTIDERINPIPKTVFGMDLDAFLRCWRMLPRRFPDLLCDIADRLLRNPVPRAVAMLTTKALSSAVRGSAGMELSMWFALMPPAS